MDAVKDGGPGVEDGGDAYGVMRCADGYFVARGIVEAVEGERFSVRYGLFPCGVWYRNGDVGRSVFMDRENAEKAEDCMESEKYEGERGGCGEQGEEPFGKI